MFIVKETIYAKNLASKKMILLHKGDIIAPKLIRGNECVIALDNTLMSVTQDVFRIFFEKV